MIRRWLGIDGVDVLIQAAITICVAAVLSTSGNPGQDETRVASTFAISFGILAVRRHFAQKRGELSSGTPASGDYVLELEQRVLELESAQQRLSELEERVDFAERLLARQEPKELRQ
jgi:hypothetical protein